MANNVMAFHLTTNIADKSYISKIVKYFCFAYDSVLLFTIAGSQAARLCLHHWVNNILGCRLESWD